MRHSRTQIFRPVRHAAWLVAFVMLAACQSAPPPMEAEDVAVPPLAGGLVYRVRPQASELRLLVYRDGLLARFGHNHVVTAPLHGEIHVGKTAAASGFRLRVMVDELVVDEPAARAGEGGEFESTLSAEARKATRQNMLGDKLLEAERFPEIRIESLAMIGPRWNPDVRAKVTLHGVSRVLEFPAAVFLDDDRLVAIATFEFRQSDFGIAPFSALGGGLKVADVMRARVRVVAVR